jgi:hypothetical protein
LYKACQLKKHFQIFDQLTFKLLQEAQQRELHGDQTKFEEAMLLKVQKNLKEKNIASKKKIECPRKCHNCGKPSH